MAPFLWTRAVLFFIEMNFHGSGLSALVVLAHRQGFLFLTLLLLDPFKQLERDLAGWLSFASQPA